MAYRKLTSAMLRASSRRYAAKPTYRSYARRPRARRPAYGRRTLRGRGNQIRRANKARKNYQLPAFLVAQINPFNPEIYRVRVPDNHTAPSSAFYCFDEVPITTGVVVNGMTGFWFYPNASYTGAAPTTVNATTVLWQAAYGGPSNLGKQAAIRAQYSVARPVAHGIKISCALAPTATTGFVHVALYSMSTYAHTTWDLPTTVAGMSELPYYKRVTLASLTQNSLIVCNKYLDQTAFRYTDVASSEVGVIVSQTFHVPNSWMGILVFVEGHNQAIGTNVLNIETICHFEGQSQFNGISLDSPCEPHRPNVMDLAGQAASSTDPMYTEGNEGAKVQELASRFATAGGTAAGTVLASAAVSGISGIMGGISGVNANTGRV